MPLTQAQLSIWSQRAAHIPDPELRQQALASLEQKRFHADGGTVYAAANVEYAPVLVRLIVALQTISDYLDNLCDRANRLDGPTFRQLHNSMRDAVVPTAPLRDYYALFGSVDDGGYLNQLVETCQTCLKQLPGYDAVQAQVSWYVERYSELQEFKHIHPAHREAKLREWSASYLEAYPSVSWWEFAAATGSTLGIFALFLAATETPTPIAADTVHKYYFPWICGLHILLDYLIDLDEDAQAGDFNFVACYPDAETAYRRLRLFAKESRQCARKIAYGGRIHRFVVQGLLAMYLSDPKVKQQKAVRKARRLLYSSGVTACLFYAATVAYRKGVF